MSVIISEKRNVFYSPSKIIFGFDTARAVGQEARRLGGEKALLVTDPVLTEAGIIRPVIESLETAEISYSIYDGVEPDPPTALVDEAADKFRREKCDLIIGMGGASSLDVAKGVSIVATNGGKVLDLCGYEKARVRPAPKVLISTTHSAGGELSPFVMMTTSREEHSLAIIISEYAIPEVAVMDPLLTMSMPPTVTVDTGLDALTTAIEAYVAEDATPFSDVLAQEAISLGAQFLPVVWAKGSNREARYFMTLTAIYAGLAFVSASVGAVHALSYAVAGRCHLTHGRSLAAVLPHVMQYNLPGNPEKYARVAELMGKDVEGLSSLEASMLAVEAVKDILEATEVSYRLQDYGVNEEDVAELAREAMSMSVLFSANPRDLKEEDVRSVYQAALRGGF